MVPTVLASKVQHNHNKMGRKITINILAAYLVVYHLKIGDDLNDIRRTNAGQNSTFILCFVYKIRTFSKVPPSRLLERLHSLKTQKKVRHFIN